jgi:hypothetical protein
MQMSMITMAMATCVVAAACASRRDVTMISPETYHTRANTGLAFGGADAATRAATKVAEDFCAAERKRVTVTNVRVHNILTRFISDITFQCAGDGEPSH